MNVHLPDRGRIRADLNFARDGAEDLQIAGDATFLKANDGASL